MREARLTVNQFFRVSRCESFHPHQVFGRLAQLVERGPYKADVAGSNPSPPTKFYSAEPEQGAWA